MYVYLQIVLRVCHAAEGGTRGGWILLSGSCFTAPPSLQCFFLGFCPATSYDTPTAVLYACVRCLCSPTRAQRGATTMYDTLRSFREGGADPCGNETRASLGYR